MVINNKEDLKRFLSDYSVKHFKADEFLCPCCGNVKIDTELILDLEYLRDKIGKPFIITSAYRCDKHNKEVGGVTHSEHTTGNAVDIKCYDSVFRYGVVNLVMKYDMTIKRIGLAHSFIHLGNSKTLPNKVIWLYSNK